MGNINTKQVSCAVMVTLAAVCLVYLFFQKFGDNGSGNQLNGMNVSASDGFKEENLAYTAVNQKIGLTFKYYKEPSTGAYSIQVIKDYECPDSKMEEVYGKNQAYLIQSKELSKVFMAVYNQANNQYYVDSVYSMDFSNYDVDNSYNGISYTNIANDQILGWMAKGKDGSGTEVKKLAIEDTFTYPAYTVTENCSPLILNAKFSNEMKQFEFSLDQATIKLEPEVRAESDNYESVCSLICFDMKETIGWDVVCNYNEDTKAWEMTAYNNLPESTGKIGEFNKNEVIAFGETGMYINKIIENIDGTAYGKIQCFDSDGKYLKRYCYDTLPTLTEVK